MRARLIGSLAAAVAAAICAMTVPAWAGYSMSGYNFQVVQSGQGLADAGISYLDEPNMERDRAAIMPPSAQVSRFPRATTIDYARLYLDIWGGMPMFTATVTVSVNGTQLAPISIGGMSDANPTYSGTKTCVYGSGYGLWQLAVAGLSNLLYTNGAANAVTWTVNDPNGNFDGRTYYASLVTVYTSSSLNQTLDYDLAEGNGLMQHTPGDTGAPSSRTLTITGVNTANVSSATYYAGYILGVTGQGSTPSLSTARHWAARPTTLRKDQTRISVRASFPPMSPVPWPAPIRCNTAWRCPAAKPIFCRTSACWRSRTRCPSMASGTARPAEVGATPPIGKAAISRPIPAIRPPSARASARPPPIVTLDGTRTLGSLAFSTTGGGSYTIARSSGDTTGTLTLTNGGGTVSIADQRRQPDHCRAVVLGSDLTVSAATGSGLTISGAISEGSPGKPVSLIGGGELILSGSDNYTGGTTVACGTLDLSTPESMPSTGTLDIERGGEVVLGVLLGDSNDSEPAVTAVAAAKSPTAPAAPRARWRRCWRGFGLSGLSSLPGTPPDGLSPRARRRLPSRPRWSCCWPRCWPWPRWSAASPSALR